MGDRRGRLGGMVAVVAVLGLFVAACGDDDGPVDAGAVGETATLPAECPDAAPFTFELRTEGSGSLEPWEVVSAIALVNAERTDWSVLLADYEMPDELEPGLLPAFGDGQRIVSVTMGYYGESTGSDPVEVGDVIRDPGADLGLSMDFFVTDGEVPLDPEGSVELLALTGDGEPGDHACLDVSYLTAEGQAGRGVVTAEIRRSP